MQNFLILCRIYRFTDRGVVLKLVVLWGVKVSLVQGSTNCAISSSSFDL